MTYSFEPMTAAHRKPVIDIFNHFVEHGHAAYPDQKIGYEYYGLFLQKTMGYPAVVIKAPGGEPVGFAFLQPHHFAGTLRQTADVTYFILPGHTGKGVGRAVLDYLIAEGRKLGVLNVLASVSSLNVPSLAFHRKAGFVEAGRLRDVGVKNGESFDEVWLQLRI